MHVIVWRYEVAPGRGEEFEREYGPQGGWAALFGQARGFVGTELFRSATRENEYLTLDVWSSEEDFEGFLAAHGDAYEANDRRTEQLTVREERIGAIRAPLPIRPAIAEDAERLSVLMRRTFTDTFAAQNRPEDIEAYAAKSYGVEQQRSEIESEEMATLLCEHDGEPIAFAQLRRRPSPAVDDPEAIELFRFYVDRPWHGRGVAQRLMREASKAAEMFGARTLWLGVWERNPRAIAFYGKCGFRDVGTQLFTVGSDVQTDRVMVSPLPVRV